MSQSSVLIGSTGLVGSFILSTLLASPPSSGPVYTISRRAPKSTGPQLNSILDTEITNWPSKLSSITPVPTTVYSALGTTRAAAGGIANQWKIDHDANVELAKAAKTAGVKNFVFISSAGTRGLLAARAPYSQMKNGVEDTIMGLGFAGTAIILRPGFILGEREESRWAEAKGQGVVKSLGRWVGLGWQDKIGQDAEVIARAAVKAARLAEEGKVPEGKKVWILEQRDIVKLGRDEWKE
ncbi:hypothetical protein QBC38DRAFT_490706 [Podospora fimiseda]|uniref:NAD-dependent epimerase/dehydratase domain-containing protein n=1 Tax=Podospora fimiseda TaxID=252190 RepID=A0AAN7BFX6_9PEZI|nr:hypothetical protein QBC38DRAFT_490706 [Podospora fimiseda]